MLCFGHLVAEVSVILKLAGERGKEFFHSIWEQRLNRFDLLLCGKDLRMSLGNWPLNVIQLKSVLFHMRK